MLLRKSGAKNAGILAAEILGVKYKEIRKKIKTYKKELRAEVEQKAENLENLEYKEYLKIMAKK